MILGKKNTDNDILVIAEIGNNHEGHMDVATRLVREAAECGLDGVKFQTYKTELFVNPADTERFQRMRSFELSHAQFRELADLAHSLGLLFISTPLDLESARFLDSIVDAYKIASGDNDFFPLIDEVIRTGKPVILSTGASNLDLLERTVSYIEVSCQKDRRPADLALLHCISCYPAPDDQVNLGAIRTLSERFPGCTAGYSDHTLGIDACIASVAAGARIVEKHFTVDKNFSAFRDHQLSADPAEMREMVRKIRVISRMNGPGLKMRQPCEEPMNSAIRRSIAARTNMKAGQQVCREDLMWIRPATGMRPGEEHAVIGKRLRSSMNQGDFFRPELLE